jgi:hypothetical protein
MYEYYKRSLALIGHSTEYRGLINTTAVQGIRALTLEGSKLGQESTAPGNLTIEISLRVIGTV